MHHKMGEDVKRAKRTICEWQEPGEELHASSKNWDETSNELYANGKPR